VYHETGFPPAHAHGKAQLLNEGVNRRSIRKVALQRLQDIRSKIANLQRMWHALLHLFTNANIPTANSHVPLLRRYPTAQSEKANATAAH
jgi:hypothetical protein